MKLEFKGITTEELSYKFNNIAPAEKNINLNPQFQRQLRRITGNDKMLFVAMSVKIESTNEAPKPFDLKITLVGIFEVEGIKDNNDQRKFNVEATKILYPYVRAAISNLTASACIPPLYLSAVTPIFPDDQEKYVFTTDVN